MKLNDNTKKTLAEVGIEGIDTTEQLSDQLSDLIIELEDKDLSLSQRFARSVASYYCGLYPDQKDKYQVIGKETLTEYVTRIAQYSGEPEYIYTQNNAFANALLSAVNAPPELLRNPNQISLNDIYSHEIEVNTADLPTFTDAARQITVHKNAQNGQLVDFDFFVEDYKTLLKHRITAYKFLVYYFSKNPFNEASISFPLSDLVEDIPWFDDIRSALRGVKSAAMLLQPLFLYDDTEGTTPIFSGGIKWKNGIVTVNKNPEIDITETGSFYALLPKSIFGLNPNAFVVAQYIFSDIRINAKNNTNGSRKISLCKIADLLNLPTETQRIKQQIITPIEKVIDEINESDIKLKVSLEIDYQLPPREQIKQGYIKYTLRDKVLLGNLSNIAQRKANIIEAKTKKKQEKENKKEAAINRAIAKKEAEKHDKKKPEK